MDYDIFNLGHNAGELALQLFAGVATFDLPQGFMDSMKRKKTPKMIDERSRHSRCDPGDGKGDPGRTG